MGVGYQILVSVHLVLCQEHRFIERCEKILVGLWNGLFRVCIDGVPGVRQGRFIFEQLVIADK